MSSPELGFFPGEQVTFRVGVFSGMDGTVLPSARPDGVLHVEIRLFGRPLTLEVDPYGVEGTDLSEAQWLACRNTARLVSVLVSQRHVSSGRKARLLACACLERVADRLTDPPLHKALATASEVAERGGGKRKLQAAGRAIQTFLSRRQNLLGPAGIPVLEEPREHLALAVAGAVALDDLVWNVAPRVAQALAPDAEPSPADLVHDIFGNPYQEKPYIDPSWRNWNRGLVARMARGIHEERHFAEMPVLADALEEAGCEDTGLLAHLRSGGHHARGCWALDAVLGLC